MPFKLGYGWAITPHSFTWIQLLIHAVISTVWSFYRHLWIRYVVSMLVLLISVCEMGTCKLRKQTRFVPVDIAMSDDDTKLSAVNDTDRTVNFKSKSTPSDFMYICTISFLPSCTCAIFAVFVIRIHPGSGACNANPGTIYNPALKSWSKSFFSSSAVEAYCKHEHMKMW